MSTSDPTGSRRSAVDACVFSQRAMLIWPRLDRRILARCGCDARRIAAYVSRRTSLSVEAITAILEESAGRDGEATTWFG